MNKKKIAVFIATLIVLTGCSGGGGGSSTPSAPAPTVTMNISAAKINLGSSANLTWTTTNATTCTASGGWAGIQATSGTSPQTPSASGVSSYTLTCTGAGGSANRTVNLTVPIPVQKSSYLNAKNTGMSGQTIPVSSGANPVTFIAATENISAGYAFGDFFQDGSYSMVAFTNNFVPNTDPNYGRTPGHAYFYKKDISGHWVDHTSDILANQTGCISPRKIIVADFNGDGIPDVFVSCHGTDLWPLPFGYTQGEVPRLLLSQPNGTYLNVAAPMSCYCHGATAADVHNNGFADIVVVDPVINKQPFYLVNNHNGTFTPDYTRMPAATAANTGCSPSCGLGIYSVELIDFNSTGNFDLWFGGANDGSAAAFATSLFHNPGTNNFSAVSANVLPLPNAPYAADFNPLDIVFINGYIYLMRVNGPYTETSIQKINYSNSASSMIYSNTSAYYNGAVWFEWIIPNQTNIISSNFGYAVSVPQ